MKLKGLRWWIVALLFGAAVLNYVDRQTLSALAPTIQHDLAMDDRDYANVVNIFLVAYTIAYLISGRIADLMGTRASMFVFVAWWSVANMLTAAAMGVRSLSAYRFLLGLGEAGVWPAASKVVSEWFPAKERALAIGIYTMGATMGATLAPYLVIPLATHAYHETLPAVAGWLGPGTGWRLAFILTGAAGLLWLIPWLWLYRQPRQSKLITPSELQLIEQSAAAENPADAAAANAWSWKQVFLFRGTWLLLLGRLITDPVWYFYQFWFPKYLSADRHLSQDQLKITWIVYAAAGVGSLLGGWLSGQLVKRGVAPAASRLWVMLGCACLMPLSPFIAQVTGLSLTMTLTVCTVFASLAWLINISSLVVDVVPKHSLGTVFSVVATGSTIGGIIMNMIVATLVSGPSTKPAGFLDQAIKTVFGPLLELVQGHGYAQWFLIMAFLHPVAWLLLKWGGVHRLGKGRAG
ncbi:MAG: MFS transporter [Verrucomicrobia bacterium]|jgi:ACS family hexuronate transporter-like MFS transporter|nr:MFS transporter [Verrucomicrobiota bacterium]